MEESQLREVMKVILQPILGFGRVLLHVTVTKTAVPVLETAEKE